MTTKSFVIAAVALVGLGAAGYGLYSLGMRHGMQMTPAAESPSPAAVAKAETGTDNVVTGEDATRRHIKDG